MSAKFCVERLFKDSKEEWHTLGIESIADSGSGQFPMWKYTLDGEEIPSGAFHSIVTLLGATK